MLILEQQEGKQPSRCDDLISTSIWNVRDMHHRTTDGLDLRHSSELDSSDGVDGSSSFRCGVDLFAGRLHLRNPRLCCSRVVQKPSLPVVVTGLFIRPNGDIRFFVIYFSSLAGRLYVLVIWKWVCMLTEIAALHSASVSDLINRIPSVSLDTIGKLLGS
jgi:hypothetical protein